MEFLISKQANWTEADVINEIERVSGGYREDENGLTYHLEADGEILKQVYFTDVSGERTVEWSIAFETFDGVANKTKVTLTA